MPFDLRCPECSSKLRFDDKPDPREEIECPKCGSTFSGKEGLAAAKSFGESSKSGGKASEKSGGRAPEKSGGKSGPPGEPKPKKVAKPKDLEPRELTNPLPILAIIAAGFLIYIVIAWFTLNQIGKAGRVEDMIAMVPGDCNVTRGANLQHLARYPGYKEILDKYATPPIKAGLKDIETAGKLKENDGTDYLIVGNAYPMAATVYVIRVKNEFTRETVAKELGGEAETLDGEKCYRLPVKADNILNGSLLWMPTRRHLVVAHGLGQDQMMKASIAAHKSKSKSLVPNLGDSGQLAVRGHTWVVIRRVGGMEGYLSESALDLAKDGPLKNLGTAVGKAPVVAVWNSFGKNIRFGYALDCDSDSTADSLVRNMKEGPMGKGDDSEPPNSLKKVTSVVSYKEFGAFMSDLSYRSSGRAAYFISNMTGDTDKWKTMLNALNITSLGNPQGQR